MPYQIRNNCYSNIRKYLQDNELHLVNATTDYVSSSKKKRKLLHKFLEGEEDEDDNNEGNT